MTRRLLLVLAGFLWPVPVDAARSMDLPAAIVADASADGAEDLAAREVRRYLYLRTGQLLPLVPQIDAAPEGGWIVVGTVAQPAVRQVGSDCGLEETLRALQPEQYLLKTLRHGDRTVVLVAGGDGVGTLYGAYRLAEHLGVRFYLEGDVVPDQRLAEPFPCVDEVGRPLFDRRGIQPFHDFPEGPDWWGAETYKAILAQLPKLRMNFFGLHTYPEGGVGPEPLTWIGLPGEVNADGSVQASYPARHFTTSNITGAWGYRPGRTSEYSYGAAALFPQDDYGADYMRDTYPWDKMSSDQQNELIARMGACLHDAFTFARRLGIKTCLGTETPLTIPTPVQQRLRAAGKDPADPEVVRDLYRGIFTRIIKTHPLDYYWLWTPEGWTWSGTKQEEIDATLADLRAAMAAAQDVGAPFTLATCGWVLGPQQDRALFDNVLPRQFPMSCINRQVGHAPVEPGFAAVQGRPKWAIPWLEDDPALVSPQLWVGRMRKDAADALAYGCTGLLGIHWRTRILGPNVSALAQAAWEQQSWNPALSGQSLPPAARPPDGPDGGQHAQFPPTDIADTQEDPLYHAVRYNVEAYYLDVPNGTYAVTLKLCEPHYDEADRRVFGVRVQGRPLIERVDLFAEFGKNRAHEVTLHDVEVNDGQLVIDFVPIVEFPCVAAIVVEGPDATRKINCGGPAWEDYQADWPPSEPSHRERFLPCADFYADWARQHFGPEAADAVAEIFTEIDGQLPRPSDWVEGPGGIKPDHRPWSDVARDYAFVDRLAAVRPAVRGAGNQERFDYWLNMFRYMQANAQVNCTWHQYNQAIAQVKAEPERAAQQRLAREVALPLRKELVAQVGAVHQYLLSAVSTYGDLGTVTNWQQHIMPTLLDQPAQELRQLLGAELPPDALPSRDYAGPPRMFVPHVRSVITDQESLQGDVFVLGLQPAHVTVVWRALGSDVFQRVPLEHVARGVYQLAFQPPADAGDFEFYVEAQSATATLRFPPTAPDLNHTVVVMPTGASSVAADMQADSPVKFPAQGALPARFPPDQPAQDGQQPEEGYYLFSTPERSLAQIAAIQQEMPRGEFTPPPAGWEYLPRTHTVLTQGGELRLLALGDSIVNDTMRSAWVAKLAEAYPQATIRATVYVRGGGGCQHYRENERIARFVVPRQPNLVWIGGISQRDIASIREVIRQLREALPDVEIVLATGTFGTADPRVADELAAAAHSGTGTYGRELQQLAEQERCAYLDMTTPWAEYVRSSGVHPHLFYRDVVHANEYGEQILSKILIAFFTQP